MWAAFQRFEREEMFSLKIARRLSVYLCTYFEEAAVWYWSESYQCESQNPNKFLSLNWKEVSHIFCRFRV